MLNLHCKGAKHFCMMAKHVGFLFAICLVTLASGNKRLVLHSDQDILAKFTAMENRLSQVEQENNRLSSLQMNTSFLSLHIAELETKTSLMESRLKSVEQENHLLKGSQGGSTYIRWGRKTCSGNGTSLVYKGYAVGPHYTHPGGGSNTLCLPDDPTWNKYSLVGQSVTYLYGTEMEGKDTQTLLGYDFEDEDIPCAVCQTDRPRKLMIPGRANCYPGWTQEYTGYLIAGYYSHSASTDFICLDEHPVGVLHGSSDDDENLMYFVQATCSSLSCPPYAGGRELACVLCTK